MVEAASAGAISAMPIIAYIIVHLIAFLSLLDFINDTLAWLGARVGVAPPDYPVLSFQVRKTLGRERGREREREREREGGRERERERVRERERE